MSIIKTQITNKLTEYFHPAHIAVVNESSMHSVPVDSETHFKVTLVSNDFEGLSQVRRHQAVYRVLSVELQSGVHALALHTYSPIEWGDEGKVIDSPQCMSKQ